MSRNTVPAPRLTPRQIQVMVAVSRCLNGIGNTSEVAARMGYRPARSGQLAVTATLRKLEKEGLVNRLPPSDRWAQASWSLRAEGREALLRAEEDI